MTNNTKDLISVILPVYNGEEHLTECIESVLSQTYDNLEFIIVDDASTDNTLNILRKFAAIDSRIKIFQHTINQKQTAAANTAIKNARGDYLARMDADDVALPSRLKKQVEFMQKNPDIGLLGSWVHLIDDNGKPYYVLKTNTSQGYLGWSLLFDTSFAHSSVMMRKDIIKQVGFYQSAEAEDYDLGSRINRLAKVANIPEILQQKRVWAGQLALKVPTETRDCVLQIMQNNMQHLLNGFSIGLELVRIIRSVTESNQPELDDKLLKQATSLINVLYDTYILKTSLSTEEKKMVTIDVLQKLYRLAKWQYILNPFKGFHSFLLIAIRNPKFVLLTQLLKISK